MNLLQSETDDLFAQTYAELRRLAGHLFRSERLDHTLQPTALVHEAYVKLQATSYRWQNREQFIATAARAMRQVLVDLARSRGYQKRGAAGRRVTLSRAGLLELPPATDVLALDAALGELARFDARKARIVELRVFGGMTVEEVAQTLAISSATVSREWRLARGWLGKICSDGVGSLHQ